MILADRIVISKADIADDEAPARLAARLRELNPRADIVEAVQGDLDPDWILSRGAGRCRASSPTEAGHTDDIASFTHHRDASRSPGRRSPAPWRR